MTFLADPYFVIFMVTVIFAAGSLHASNRWVHKCQERRLKRIEKKLKIEDE